MKTQLQGCMYVQKIDSAETPTMTGASWAAYAALMPDPLENDGV